MPYAISMKETFPTESVSGIDLRGICGDLVVRLVFTQSFHGPFVLFFVCRVYFREKKM
jgi:hypothetical protein